MNPDTSESARCLQYRNNDSGRIFPAGVDSLGGYAGSGLLGPDAWIVGEDAVLREVG